MATARTSKTLPASGKSSSAKDAKILTHERLERDMAAFKAAGGEIERLGNTCTLKKIK